MSARKACRFAAVLFLALAGPALADRNGSGTFTNVAGIPVVTKTTISSAMFNAFSADLALNMTDSLDRSGKGGMLAPLLLNAGTFALPGLAWVLETNSGFYRVALHDFGLSINATKVAEWTTTLETLSLQLSVNPISGTAITGTGVGSGLGVVGFGGTANGVGIQGNAGGTNGWGGDFTGNGTGFGIHSVCSGGATTCVGGFFTGGGTGAGGVGVQGTGGGTTGPGVQGFGSGSGAGVTGQGGGIGGVGVTGTGVGGGYGGVFSGQGNGYGLTATGGSSGIGGLFTGQGGGVGLVANGGPGIAGAVAANGTAATSGVRQDALSLSNGDLDLSGVVQPSSSLAVSANRLTNTSIPKGWAKIHDIAGALTVSDGQNISTVGIIGGTNILVTLARPCINSTFAVLANTEIASASQCIATTTGGGNNTTTISCWGTTGTQFNFSNSSADVSIVVFCRQ